jgi:hypothetical protein
VENVQNINITFFGMVFLHILETLQLPTVQDQAKAIDISNKRFPVLHTRRFPDPARQIKSLKISEFTSWSVSFGIICLLTGLLKFLKLGVTMEPVTSIFFFFSLFGLIYSVSKAIKLSNGSLHKDGQVFHELN